MLKSADSTDFAAPTSPSATRAPLEEASKVRGHGKLSASSAWSNRGLLTVPLNGNHMATSGQKGRGKKCV